MMTDTEDTIPVEEPTAYVPKVTNPELSSADKQRVENFLAQNSDIFAQNMSQLGCTHMLEHVIYTGDAPP